MAKKSKMFKFKIDKKIISDATNQCENHNFGKRSEANGTKKEQIVGLIGEQMIRDLFNAGQIDGSIGFDGGYDIKINNKLIDVKTMGRNCDPRKGFVSNFMKLQENHKANYFIFTSLNKKTKHLSVCGWISKKEFLDNCDFYSKGSFRTRTNGTKFKLKAGLYEIDNDKLNKVNTPEELIKQIKND